MGMFDYVEYECECPACGTKVEDFQSKDGDCTLDTLQPDEVRNFYSSCKNCGIWIDAEYIAPKGGVIKINGEVVEDVEDVEDDGDLE